MLFLFELHAADSDPVSLVVLAVLAEVDTACLEHVLVALGLAGVHSEEESDVEVAAEGEERGH